MSWVDVYADFALTTEDTYFDSREKLINQATDRSPILGKFLREAATSKILQGGERLRFQTFFDEKSTAENYGGANPEFTLDNPQIVTEGVADWRFTADHMVWTDHEIGLQANSRQTREANYRTIRSIFKTKDQRLATSIIKFLEAQCFEAHSNADMESQSGQKPFSLASFITEEDSGGKPLGVTSGQTIEGIDPETETGWTNQTGTYAQYAAGNTGLLAAFDDMYLSIKYHPLPKFGDQGEPLNDPKFIAASKLGVTRLMQQLRTENSDLLGAVSRSDPSYLNPRYGGIEILYASTLDSAALYDNGSTVAVAEASADITGPRYWWVDTDSVCKVFHNDRYFSRHKPKPHQTQPFSHVMYVDTWHQMVCTERRKLGIVSPSVDLT